MGKNFSRKRTAKVVLQEINSVHDHPLTFDMEKKENLRFLLLSSLSFFCALF